MTIVDQVKAYTRSIVQAIVDKEPISYLEAAGLFGIILQGRHNISVLSSLYNQAQHSGLKALLAEAIDGQMQPMIKKCEELMAAGQAELPEASFPPHPLYAELEYPAGVRLTDGEIALAAASMARNTQLALFLTLQQCYQLEIIRSINQLITSGLEWDYRLLQLALHEGWLPKIAKVVH